MHVQRYNRSAKLALGCGWLPAIISFFCGGGGGAHDLMPSAVAAQERSMAFDPWSSEEVNRFHDAAAASLSSLASTSFPSLLEAPRGARELADYEAKVATT